MLYRSLSVAIILLLSWFAYTSMQSSKLLSLQLIDLKRSVAEKSQLVAADQLKIDKKIGEIQTFIVSQNQLNKAKQKIELTLSKQKKLTQLHKTYSTVLNAELLRLDKRHVDAAGLLKSAKKEIWKAGDTYKDKQKILRALMPKIDALVKTWSEGNSGTSAKAIYVALDKIIQEKGK